MQQEDEETVNIPGLAKNGNSLGIFAYHITYAPDHTLQWDPPPNSRELAIALSYHFPLEPDLESKMRAGVIKFLTGQDPPPTLKRDSHRYLTPEDDETPPTSGQSEQLPKVKSKPNEKDMLKVVAWEPCNGPKGGFNRREVKRRRYQTEEGAKVARNRGNACERHRRQKLKCDPDTCSNNRQRLTKLGIDLNIKPLETASPTTNLDLQVEDFRNQPLGLTPLVNFHGDSFSNKQTTGWGDYSPVSFTQDMSVHQGSCRTPWPTESHLISDESWSLPLDISPSDTTDMMILDSGYNYDAIIGNSDIDSFSWQGSSNLDPGIFFIPNVPARESCLTVDGSSKFTQDNLISPMFQTDFNSCHSLVFPSDSIITSELQYEQHMPLPGSSPSQPDINGSSLRTTLAHNVKSKATAWYFNKTPADTDGVSGTTITIGTGDDACSTIFKDKLEFVEKLKMLISDPEYYFCVPDLVQDPELLTSFCRATYGKRKTKGVERLQELPYIAVPLKLK